MLHKSGCVECGGEQNQVYDAGDGVTDQEVRKITIKDVVGSFIVQFKK
jgi:hypothetical protein